MKTGITATQQYPPDCRVIEQTLPLFSCDEWYSGGAFGGDTAAIRFIAEYLPWDKNILVQPNAKFNKECLDLASEIIVLDKLALNNPADAYRQRNMRIVTEVDRLLAFPKSSKEELRSGTWMTIRMAVKQNVPVHIYPINGDKPYNL